MSVDGLEAYKTYLGCVLHFRNESTYDGWQYNFNGKVKSETFEANRGLVHRYRSIEAMHPSKQDQLRFFYPAFRAHGYVKASDIQTFTKSFHSFNNKFENLWYMDYGIEVKQVASSVSSIDELLGVANSLPVLYNAYIEEMISYESLLLLMIAIPSINKIVSDDPYLWQSLLDKLKFDSKFYKLYLKDDKTIEQLKSNTVALLKSAWNIQ